MLLSVHNESTDKSDFISIANMSRERNCKKQPVSCVFCKKRLKIKPRPNRQYLAKYFTPYALRFTDFFYVEVFHFDEKMFPC